MNMLAQVTTNPTLGVTIFALGGLAGAVFYLPLKKVRLWAWESYWLVWAVFALVLVPLILAFTTSPNWISVVTQAPAKEVLYCYLCGAAWGLGGLTWGLMIRYLGFGLGLGLGCGLCSAVGCGRASSPNSSTASRAGPRSSRRPFRSSGSCSSAWRACPRKRSFPRNKKRRRWPSTTSRGVSSSPSSPES